MIISVTQSHLVEGPTKAVVKAVTEAVKPGTVIKAFAGVLFVETDDIVIGQKRMTPIAPLPDLKLEPFEFEIDIPLELLV